LKACRIDAYIERVREVTEMSIFLVLSLHSLYFYIVVEMIVLLLSYVFEYKRFSHL